ncbi:MAG: hypothetical protein ACJAQ6_002496 [Arenicella sp.]|jgi:hypothetical protein
MASSLRHVGAAIGLLLIVSMVVYDSSSHFDKGLIQVKRQNGSAQRNWNIFYGQRFVYYDGPFRYLEDLRSIGQLIEPRKLILSDLATSYYSSAALPSYVSNIHRHQGRNHSFEWSEMLDKRVACNFHQDDGLNEFKQFIALESLRSREYKRPEFSYVLVNKDVNNRNVRLDCMWQRRASLIENIEKLASEVYDGEYLRLYKLDSDSTSTASERH